MGHIDVVRELCAQGADINEATGADGNLRVTGIPAGFTPLHFAALFGYSDVCIFLGTQGAYVDASTKVAGCLHSFVISAGNTPLHLAALNGHQDICTLLVLFGADPDSNNEEAHTPTDCAVSKGFEDFDWWISNEAITELVHRLLKKGLYLHKLDASQNQISILGELLYRAVDCCDVGLVERILTDFRHLSRYKSHIVSPGESLLEFAKRSGPEIAERIEYMIDSAYSNELR